MTCAVTPVDAAMNPPILPRFLAVAAALLALGVPGVSAQDPGSSRATGRIQGVVFDSTAAAPLADAAVFLWGTTHRAISDTDGRYVLEGVPEGEYTLLLFHTRLGELGISSGPRQVVVRAGAVTQVDLGIPSWFTIVIGECRFEERRAGTGAIAGWVGDGESGMGMPGAQVSLAWPVAGSREPSRRELETDAMGWYRVCDAPAGTPIAASARFLNREGLRREISVGEGGMIQAGFLLWELQPAKISGAVHDATTGLGVQGAEVWLRGTTLRAVTGKDGSFRLGDVPAGTYMLFAEHLRYGTRQDTLVAVSGQTLAVDVRVDTRAIDLDPITVTVESRPLTERAMGGLTITRAQIDRIETRVRDTGELIQTLNLPGVIVRRRADGTLCVGYGPGQAHMMSFGGCVSMEVYVNGVHATSTEMALHIPPEAVDRIVLFRPVEAGNLFPINAANGVLVIYTRR